MDMTLPHMGFRFLSDMEREALSEAERYAYDEACSAQSQELYGTGELNNELSDFDPR